MNTRTENHRHRQARRTGCALCTHDELRRRSPMRCLEACWRMHSRFKRCRARCGPSGSRCCPLARLSLSAYLCFPDGNARSSCPAVVACESLSNAAPAESSPKRVFAVQARGTKSGAVGSDAEQLATGSRSRVRPPGKVLAVSESNGARATRDAASKRHDNQCEEVGRTPARQHERHDGESRRQNPPDQRARKVIAMHSKAGRRRGCTAAAVGRRKFPHIPRHSSTSVVLGRQRGPRTIRRCQARRSHDDWATCRQALASISAQSHSDTRPSLRAQKRNKSGAC